MSLRSILLSSLIHIFILSGLSISAQDNDSSMILLSPPDDMIIENILPRFSWTPPDGNISWENISYELRIVRVWEDQDSRSALSNNPPWLMESDIIGNSHQFQVEAPSLVIASPYHQNRPTVREMEARLFQKESLMAKYAWQVTVMDEDGKPTGNKSNINTFNILTTNQGYGYPDISFDIASLTPMTMDLNQLFPSLQTEQAAIFDGFCIASPLTDDFRAKFLDIGTYQPDNIRFDAGIVIFSESAAGPDGSLFTIEWIDNESLDIRWTWDEWEQSIAFPMINLTLQSAAADGPQLGVFVFTFLDIFEQPVYQDEFMVLLGCQ